MLPVEPEHMKTASSIQREDYHCHFTHLRKIADERAATIRANKSMHENASFAIGNEASQVRRILSVRRKDDERSILRG